MRRKLMFWVWDREINWLEKAASWICCKIWGHEPAADCSIPEHDYCNWCFVSMPGKFKRG